MDIYYTIKSRRIAIQRKDEPVPFPCPFRFCSADEARQLIKDFQNRYHDARHVCWAYMLGPERAEWHGQ